MVATLVLSTTHMHVILPLLKLEPWRTMSCKENLKSAMNQTPNDVLTRIFPLLSLLFSLSSTILYVSIANTSSDAESRLHPSTSASCWSRGEWKEGGEEGGGGGREEGVNKKKRRVDRGIAIYNYADLRW